MASPLSNEFVLPTNKAIGASSHPEPDSICTYLCGNSLGPLSKRSKALVEQELNAWGTCAVTGHFSTHPYGRGWVDFCDHITPLFAELVGAQEKEVACMGTLTANLHLMMDSFYKPTPERYKILLAPTFLPLAHGLDPAKAVLEMSPRPGEYILREQDILDIIAREGASIALVIFSGVQYYTGQWFPMQSITRAAQAQGCVCGWDLAHAVGNVPLSLHDWGVDFAVWCTYKYVNAGPGSIAGLYVHEKWKETELPKFAGWWGHDPATRFAMPPKFSPIEGAQGFQQSNPSILASASLLGSLQIFKEAGMMQPLRERSVQLTAALEKLLMQSKYFVPVDEASTRQSDTPAFTIITPIDPNSRGAQLSLLFLPSGVMQSVHDALTSLGVIGDERKPDVIRLAPAPLFNTLEDCKQGALSLERVFDNLA
ncbi:pyridoxal phosphate-dependent transferase [Mycena rosella]|uniref:Kynureninase n=1 Tax=Mycena rosella TaxID=1033263 RepID=A0AAD7H2B9_MYCRO|nr:pyridoxal phosphate-dependent transferase [Mycena rosella]